VNAKRALASVSAFIAGFALVIIGLTARDLRAEDMAWVVPLVSVPSAVVYALGALKWSSWPRWPAALAAGALIAAVVLPLSWFLPKNPFAVVLWGALWLGACLLAPRVLRRQAASQAA
jgi:hypothetical protein